MAVKGGSFSNLLLYLLVWAGRLASSTSSPVNATGVECSQSYLDRCLQEMQPLLDSPLTKGIPHTQEAVLVSCRAFKGGMSCIDHYKDNCLHRRQQLNLERHVAGARHTFAFLCDDPVFQSEFLQHQSCFRGTSRDWGKCANHFQRLVDEEMVQNVSRAQRNLGLCCAKHGFVRCIYYASQFKCRTESASFLNRLARTLTDDQVHEESCRNVKFDEICIGNAAVVAPRSSFLLLLLFLVKML